MGLYDINLKRTVIGYQFDHNVYIGNQTNENRVVTFKELGNVINSVSGGGGSGSVTSVAMTAPTGFTVSGSPVTGAGVLALNFADGYSLPTTTKQAEWDSKAVVNANNNFTTTQTITGSDDTPLNLYANNASWANIAFYNNVGTRLGNLGFIDNTPYYWGVNGSTDYHPLGTVTSVAMTAPTGFTISGSPITESGTLALSFATGYSLPTTAKQGEWDNKGTVTSVAMTAPTGFTVSGGPVTKTGTLALNFANGYSLPTTDKQIEWDNKATKAWVEGTRHTFTNSISFNSGVTINTSPTVLKHLTVYGDNETDTDKPANNTGLTGDVDTKYWNTGISTYDRTNQTGYQYSFPAHSGTFVTFEDIQNMPTTVEIIDLTTV